MSIIVLQTVGDFFLNFPQNKLKIIQKFLKIISELFL